MCAKWRLKAQPADTEGACLILLSTVAKRSTHHQGFTPASVSCSQWELKWGWVGGRYDIQWYHIACNTETLAVTLTERHFVGTLFFGDFFTLQGDSHTFWVMVQLSSRPTAIWGITVLTMCVLRNFCRICFVHVSLCVSSQRPRCNTYNPLPKRCWVSSQQVLAGLFQLLLPGYSHH